MKKADFAKKPVLTGQRTILRPFEPGDGEKMVSILEEADVRRLTGSAENDEQAHASTTLEQGEHIRVWYDTRNAANDRLDLAIVDAVSGQLVGEAVFNEYDENTGNVNFRILIGAAGQGRGLGSEAIALFVRYGFEQLGLHRIGLEVFSFNPRAERTYVKNGFVPEGVKREEFAYNGEYIDSKVYGMLRGDYDNRTFRP